jgi:hypothetical protein
MLELFRQGGQWSWMLLVIGVVVAALVIQNVLRLRRARAEDALPIRQGIHAILFWGAVAAVLGFLGQCSGIYEGLVAIGAAETISPSRVAAGIAASCSSAILGMGVLLVVALACALLSGWWRRAFGRGGRS